MNKSNKLTTFLHTLILGLSLSSLSSFSSFAVSDVKISNITSKVENNLTELAIESDEYKHELMTKLKGIDQFSALFDQVIVDNQGNVLQQGSGDLSVKRPNLVRWNTVEPDESLIVSDGKSIFLFDPFIEQVTAYKLDGAIANTPILLITSDSLTLWDQYSVQRLSASQYLITANNQESRIKSLEISFNNKNELSGFTFLDVTGQLSKISLKNTDFSSIIESSIFNFTVPEGVLLDDQR